MVSSINATSTASVPASFSEKILGALYRPGKALFEAGTKSDAFVKGQIAKTPANEQTIFTKAYHGLLKTGNWVVKNSTDLDFRKMVELGKSKFAQSPIGTLMFMVLPFTIGPRIVQALKRSQDGDKSEVMDILRRDIPTIMVLLFAYEPLEKWVHKLSSNRAGVPLTFSTAHGKEVQSFSGSKQLRLDSPEKLKALLEQDASKGLDKSLRKTFKNWKKAVTNDPQLLDNVSKLETLWNETLQASADNDAKLLSRKSREFIKLMESLDAERKIHIEGLSKKLAGKLKGEWPEIANSLTKHIERSKLPIAAGTFALVALGIGFFPVWFNDMWNRKKFNEAETANAFNANTPANPLPNARETFSSLRQSSRLAH